MFVELDQAAHTLVVFPLTSFSLSFQKKRHFGKFIVNLSYAISERENREINSPCPSGEMAIQLFSFFFGIANETKMLLQ